MTLIQPYIKCQDANCDRMHVSFKTYGETMKLDLLRNRFLALQSQPKDENCHYMALNDDLTASISYCHQQLAGVVIKNGQSLEISRVRKKYRVTKTQLEPSARTFKDRPSRCIDNWKWKVHR